MSRFFAGLKTSRSAAYDTVRASNCTSEYNMRFISVNHVIHEYAKQHRITSRRVNFVSFSLSKIYNHNDQESSLIHLESNFARCKQYELITNCPTSKLPCSYPHVSFRVFNRFFVASEGLATSRLYYFSVRHRCTLTWMKFAARASHPKCPS